MFAHIKLQFLSHLPSHDLKLDIKKDCMPGVEARTSCAMTDESRSWFQGLIVS